MRIMIQPDIVDIIDFNIYYLMISSPEETESMMPEKNTSQIDKLPLNSSLESTIAWINKFHETLEHKLATIKLDI